MDTLGFPGNLGCEGRKVWSLLTTENPSVSRVKLMITRETLTALYRYDFYHYSLGIGYYPLLSQGSCTSEYDLWSFFIL